MKKAIILASLILGACANSGSNEKASYTDPYCENTGALCGAIVFGNGAAFTTFSKEKLARLTEPSGSNPSCPQDEIEVDTNINTGDYIVFTVPATCSYELKVKIKNGSKTKTRNLMLTAGCEIVAQVSTNDDWEKIKATWANGDSGTPVDKAGNICGQI